MFGHMCLVLGIDASIAGLFLIVNYTTAIFVANDATVNLYNRLRTEKVCQSRETVSPEKFIISLLNVQ